MLGNRNKYDTVPALRELSVAANLDRKGKAPDSWGKSLAGAWHGQKPPHTQTVQPGVVSKCFQGVSAISQENRCCIRRRAFPREGLISKDLVP